MTTDDRITVAIQRCDRLEGISDMWDVTVSLNYIPVFTSVASSLDTANQLASAAMGTAAGLVELTAKEKELADATS